MIITISGPSSTGKTSLIENLRKHQEYLESLVQMPVVFGNESVREVVSSQYKLKSLQDIFKDQEESLKLQFKVAEYNKSLYSSIIKDNHCLYIFDRGPLDNLIYTLLCFNNCSSDLMLKYANDFSNYCALNQWLSENIDLILLTKPDDAVLSPEDDGFRPDLFSLLRCVETELFKLVFRGLKVVDLPSDHNDRLVCFFSEVTKLAKNNK